MEDLTEKIDLYLKARLSAKEQTAFEREIATDEELQKAVDLQRKTTELLEAGAFLDMKDRINALNSEVEKKTGTFSFLKIAAVFIGLLLAAYGVMNYSYADQQLYADYFEPYPDRITSMGKEENTVAKAIEFYNEKNYAKAASSFKKVREQQGRNELHILYEAIALTQSNQADKAISLLNEYPATNTSLTEAYNWQMILANLANQKGDEAYTLILKYNDGNPSYKKESALQLEKDLESIWR